MKVTLQIDVRSTSANGLLFEDVKRHLTRKIDGAILEYFDASLGRNVSALLEVEEIEES